MGISIVPLPGLQRGFETEAFTTSDCREIHVDEFVYTKRIRRYRFSLAHELGHIVLHREIYQAARFHSIDEWKQFIEALPKKEYNWFEYQAYWFAGLVLVPREKLEVQTEEAVGMAIEHGIETIDKLAWEYIASYLSDVFEVSEEVIEKRLEKDGIKTADWLTGHGFM